ncbi:TcpQ domain-containing protein [Pectobacterium atrosepticum]|uniref:TcpQ domain-containing protein n=1 Tax=Pectobacterium atrosepticum TaxID=29471 RepID=UPI0030185B69
MNKIAFSFLIPPMLAGCSGLITPKPSQETPALVFVDGQISDSADIIAQTQRRLSPPSAPKQVSSIVPAPRISPPLALTPKLKSTNSTQTTAKTSKQAPSPKNPSMLTNLVNVGQQGQVSVLSVSTERNLTLQQWVRRILPAEWQLEYENALRPILATRIVTVDTNDQWTRVLSRLLTEQSIEGQVDWGRKMLTLRRPGQNIMPTEPKLKDLNALPIASKNPFSGQTESSSQNVKKPEGKATTVITPLNPPPIAATSVAPINKPVSLGQAVPSAPIGKTWSAHAGSTLRENMMKWAADTRCEGMSTNNWTVIWPTSVTDYRLDAPLVFHGTFESMLRQVFELYSTAKTPLYGEATRTQCLVSVSDTPAKQ